VSFPRATTTSTDGVPTTRMATPALPRVNTVHATSDGAAQLAEFATCTRTSTPDTGIAASAKSAAMTNVDATDAMRIGAADTAATTDADATDATRLGAAGTAVATDVGAMGEMGVGAVETAVATGVGEQQLLVALAGRGGALTSGGGCWRRRSCGIGWRT
jgi:hypothetical protein